VDKSENDIEAVDKAADSQGILTGDLIKSMADLTACDRAA
jgi:hypothetical protein